jgi:hypothetical protein
VADAVRPSMNIPHFHIDRACIETFIQYPERVFITRGCCLPPARGKAERSVDLWACPMNFRHPLGTRLHHHLPLFSQLGAPRSPVFLNTPTGSAASPSTQADAPVGLTPKPVLGTRRAKQGEVLLLATFEVPHRTAFFEGNPGGGTSPPTAGTRMRPLVEGWNRPHVSDQHFDGCGRCPLGATQMGLPADDPGRGPGFEGGMLKSGRQGQTPALGLKWGMTEERLMFCPQGPTPGDNDPAPRDNAMGSRSEVSGQTEADCRASLARSPAQRWTRSPGLCPLGVGLGRSQPTSGAVIRTAVAAPTPPLPEPDHPAATGGAAAERMELPPRSRVSSDRHPLPRASPVLVFPVGGAVPQGTIPPAPSPSSRPFDSITSINSSHLWLLYRRPIPACDSRHRQQATSPMA